MKLSDKIKERKRYDRVANQLLSDNTFSDQAHGALAYPFQLRSPYEFFHECVLAEINEGSSVLEIGSGKGNHVFELLETGAKVTATDISETSLTVIKKITHDKKLDIQIADMEALPFADSTFDYVTSVSSLSYGKNNLVLGEIYRVIKPGGAFLCVDSLNHNPIYRLNRFLHYLRGNRTKSTLLNMPTLSLVEDYKNKFGSVDVRFFGSLVWVVPFLTRCVGPTKTKNVIDFVDHFISTKRSAFKFVMVARKVIH